MPLFDIKVFAMSILGGMSGVMSLIDCRVLLYLLWMVRALVCVL